MNHRFLSLITLIYQLSMEISENNLWFIGFIFIKFHLHEQIPLVQFVGKRSI